MIGSSHEALTELRVAIEHFARAAPTPTPPARSARWRPHTADSARHELRWRALDAQLAGHVSGRRVLLVGPATDYDAAAFAARGAEEVVGETTWEQLDPARNGTFDLVHCNDVLHRVLEPMSLLGAMRRVTAPQGLLLIGSVMIADPERSEYLRFVPDRHAGDPTWWFVPGQLAFRWLVRAAGFEVEAVFGEQRVPAASFPLITGYLRARPR